MIIHFFPTMRKGQFDLLKIRGARVHNLKNINVDIPKNKLVVITGVSGSGKSSLAFDTIYAEAERRYVESLSSYARQFLGVKDKPDVESIEGLSPAISIDQKSISKNPRSTVGTITEIYDYLRILFARIGVSHCPRCNIPVTRQTITEIVDTVYKHARTREVYLLAPLIRGKKGLHKEILEEVKRAGFLRVRLDGVLLRIDDAMAQPQDRYRIHSLEVLVDRLVSRHDLETSRIRDSVETGLKVGKGMLIAGTRKENAKKEHAETEWQDVLLSEKAACAQCGINLPDIEPRTFSFNSPYGACPRCTGLGSTLEVDPDLVFPNPQLSIAEGGIRPWASSSHRLGRQSWYWWVLDDLATRYGFSLKVPIGELAPEIKQAILFGETQKGEEVRFEGVIPNLKRRWKETDSDFTRAEIEKYMRIHCCEECGGRRLRKEALYVKIGEETISSITEATVAHTRAFFRTLGYQRQSFLSPTAFKIALPLAKEIGKRLNFLCDVGLEYLTLARASTTLSGGEAQRIQLATQIGSRLTGILYILDEPSIGLHARDHARLIQTLKQLRDLGNTVIIVEHDRETMHSSDWIVDIGPGAGRHGGKVVFSGPPKLLRSAHTLTASYLLGKKKVSIPSRGEYKKADAERVLIVKRAHEHNLKQIDVRIPLGKFVCVSGVSGSGKSTLVNDILAKALLAKLHGAQLIPGAHEKIDGIEYLDKVIVVDQSPIGRTPRSNPATYTGAFSFIRELFARTVDARARGYTPGRFSFNVKGGRCEACEGQGVKKIEMYFLPDVFVECEECEGKRYNREALEITYQGKNIAEVLKMPIEDARVFFTDIPQIFPKLEAMTQVGLGYMQVGQPATTLSGGEAQRVKLATELSRRDTGRTLYILDEPTTGLHFGDIQKLLNILHALVVRGNSVLVIEHNMDVLRNADWIIDLGPEGGERGGMIVAEGTPAQVKRNKKSYTGQWLIK
ncbi:MAG: excinuclease ABC subunit A [Parcubacteria group bacterium Gr01-1014_66]|nr:MAG: excinuclease ABC subunit A [Parcubacteria group bacterium Gr01-1014_66]